MTTWPVDWPRYQQSNEICDMLAGDCICGGRHKTGEFTLVKGALYRFGTSASSSAVRISEFNELKKENEKLRIQVVMGDSREFIDKAVDFRVIVRDMLSNTREFSFSNVENVSKIKEAMKIILYGMSPKHLVQTLKGAKDE